MTSPQKKLIEDQLSILQRELEHLVSVKLDYEHSIKELESKISKLMNDLSILERNE